MTKEKFIYDSETVLKFIQYFCDHKHNDEEKIKDLLRLNYNNEDLHQEITYNLCKECEHTLLYSYEKLQDCPFQDKPSCRKCKEPCYERIQWKKSAKIMKYSGMQLGLVKIRKMFKIGA